MKPIDPELIDDACDWCDELAATVTSMENHARALAAAGVPELAAVVRACTAETAAAIEKLRDALEEMSGRSKP